MVNVYEREKRIRRGKRTYVYRYKITEENLGLLWVEGETDPLKIEKHRMNKAISTKVTTPHPMITSSQKEE